MKNMTKQLSVNFAKFAIMVVIALAIGLFITSPIYAKTYTVTPKNVGKNCKHYSDYNKYTKHSAGLNYYLAKLEKKGGGTLVLKKGTYKLSNTVYVPSNVTIILKDGVVLKNIYKTGGAKYKASSSMFMMCPKSKKDKKGAIKKYKGSKNIKIIGEGNVIIDANYCDGAAIICSHNKNITITGITFKNMKQGHFIELNGTNTAEISNNIFKNAYSKTKNKYYNKEAINIDCDDSTTGGLNVVWSKKDKTPCKNITISNNIFDNVTRGIGTHKYSVKNGKNVYHTNIVIKGNHFKNIYDNGIFVLNWKNPKIENNQFDDIGTKSTKTYSSGSHGISGGGVEGISITGNQFRNIKCSSVYFCVQTNNGGGSHYPAVKVNITDEEIKNMLNNTVVNCGYDKNDKYTGLDILVFRGDSTRNHKNCSGINFTTDEIVLQ